jgi:hypothetical protein
MVEKDKLFTTKVKHKGVFDFKNFYQVIYQWLKDEGYEVAELSYKEVVTGVKEIRVNWEATDKKSDYFRFKMPIEFHLLGITDTEVEINGIKQKLQKGQIAFKVDCILEKDYQNQWESNSFIKYLRKIYDEFLIFSRIDRLERKLLGDADDLVAYSKSFFGLQGI